MASDSASAPGKSKEEKAAKRAEKKERIAAKEPVIDVPALERRVHLAELRAREVEAEVRYFEATAKRRDMKSEKRGKKRKGKSDKPSADTKD
jgi:hypothetical protein